MPIKTIDATASLDACWREVTFSAAMLTDPDAGIVGSQLAPFEARIDSLRTAQRSKWRDEIVADAKVAQADRALDVLTTKLSSELLHLDGGNRETPRFKLYFKKAPSEVVRLALGAQIVASQSWPSALASESEPSLKALATDFTNALAAGKAALDARAAAQIATATHRARELVPFVDDLNAARQSMYGQLSTIAGQTRKPRGWAESFFLRSSSGDEATPTPT